ncbi:uncharacterized protein [Mycetomoellerius zeteki]|uniref:uncharacterized protein n=1 Tax=Mycetomoellerius zeteki TaxID=64791 RepID=UPI00084E6E3A|nr:PREDICTED: uncharacterized protein LOC108722356 [Trachymyrmex zeteki]
MAIADARYRFIWVDIGDYGSLNDAGIWSNTAMKEAFENNTLSIPKACPLPNTNCSLPFCVVGDESFPLKTYLMRPFARRNLQNNNQRIFNYRLSRARRVIENAFGILVARWRILLKPLALKLSTVEKIIQAITCLHNYIITTKAANNQYLNEGMINRENNGAIIPGNWRNIGENNLINSLGRVGANIGTAAAIK